ncbi:DUF6350 family protein [Agromyces sp. MMS24-K17]|uniref:cell division protein PerM n=1 Tax=Agromyces sp. MMS24-K17 TaxID=3372850 RepID=UPI00375458F7
MSRLTIALLAALEAAVAALVGLGAVVVPLMLLWSVHFGLAVDVAAFLRAAGDVWLIGHGVDLVVTLDAVTAGQVGVAGAEAPFTISIALLGFALVTVLFGRRIGRRSTAAGHAVVGGIAAVAVYAGTGLAVGLSTSHPAASHRLWEAVLLPAAVMALGVVIGSVGEALRAVDRAAPADDPVAEAAPLHPLAARIAQLPEPLVDGARTAVRVGAGAAFAVLGVAALLVAVLIAVDYAKVIGLSQALGAGVDGGVAITIGELALLPNVIVWTAAWLLGPGFALGAGTSVSPTATVLGPLPGVPILGIMPADGVPLGILWLLVPMVAGFAGATLAWPRLEAAASLRGPSRREVVDAWWMPIAIAAGSGVVAGVVLGTIAWWSAGAVGPGRLVEVGPPWVQVALMAALTVTLGAFAGAFTARALGRAPDASEDRAARDRDRFEERFGSGRDVDMAGYPDAPLLRDPQRASARGAEPVGTDAPSLRDLEDAALRARAEAAFRDGETAPLPRD